MSDGISTATRGTVFEVTIDRPKANAIDLAASRRLNQVFTAFRDDPALRVAIITGAGERFFSPGWDLKGAAVAEESDEDWGVGASEASIIRATSTSRSSRQLTVSPAAAASRSCWGRTSSSWRSTRSSRSRRSTSACSRTPAPSNCGGAFLPRRRRVPDDGPLDGRHRSEALGVANHVVRKARVSQKHARSPSSSPTVRHCCSRHQQLLRHTEMVAEHPAFELHDSLSAVQKVIRSEDLKEGARAFGEKRKPVWKGK